MKLDRILVWCLLFCGVLTHEPLASSAVRPPLGAAYNK